MPKIRGVEAHLARLRALADPSVKRALASALEEGGGTLIAEASHLITQGASGTGKNHVVSKPGHPPNEEYGDLRQSLHVRVVGDPTDMHIQAVADAPHAVPLEGGTTKMAARPFMTPATEATRKQIVTRVRKQMNQIIAGKRVRS